jgi:uncharacterized oxidoreductase
MQHKHAKEFAMTPTGNTILITGGTSGIGLALAKAFHALGNTVIIAGRRKTLLDEAVATHPGMAAYVLDVEDPASITSVAAKIEKEHPKLNVLVNNAGIMRAENLAAEEIDLADAEATITTNLLAPVRLIAALLPHFRAQPKSAIINVTSGLAFVPLAYTPTYSATKAALHSYTQSLRHQLRDTSVEVLELAPPMVQTDLMPGQASNPQGMPLADFISESIAQLQKNPTPPEILVDRVNILRRAEAEGRFGQVFGFLNPAG